MGATATPFTPENLITLRTAFDFAEREVLAELCKINPVEVANDIFQRAKPDLDATAAGLLNALATDTAQDYITAVVRDNKTLVSNETLLLFCRLCLERATDIMANITTQD